MLGRNNSARGHIAEERWSEYLDNRLEAKERARIEQHLRECADCRAALASLRWTIELVKHAPAPVSARAFTLPVPAPRAQRSSLAFGFAQFGAALATLLLIAVIGVDVLTQFGGGMSAPMVSTAKEFAEPTLAIAAAPQMETRDQVDSTAPTTAAQVLRPTSAPAPTKAPMPTVAPPAAAPPAPLSLMPTATLARPVGASAAQTPDGKGVTADAEKARSATAAPRVGFAITATVTISAPTSTLTPGPTATTVPPTAPAPASLTRVAQAQVTRAPQPTQASRAVAQPFLTPLRVVELGLLFLAIVFGAMVVMLWRKK